METSDIPNQSCQLKDLLPLIEPPPPVLSPSRKPVAQGQDMPLPHQMGHCKESTHPLLYPQLTATSYLKALLPPPYFPSLTPKLFQTPPPQSGAFATSP
jgi:hypothetical protein